MFYFIKHFVIEFLLLSLLIYHKPYHVENKLYQYINKIFISSLHKLFNSFLVFSEWTTSAISKTIVLNAFVAWIYHLPVKICLQFHSSLYTQNKSFHSRILLNVVLIPKLISNPFASCSFTNLDFLNPHSVHFDCIINLPFFLLKI